MLLTFLLCKRQSRLRHLYGGGPLFRTLSSPDVIWPRIRDKHLCLSRILFAHPVNSSRNSLTTRVSESIEVDFCYGFTVSRKSQWRNGGRGGPKLSLGMGAPVVGAPVDCCYCLTEILYLAILNNYRMFWKGWW